MKQPGLMVSKIDKMIFFVCQWIISPGKDRWRTPLPLVLVYRGS